MVDRWSSLEVISSAWVDLDMTKDDEILSLKGRILELEKENEDLKKALNFPRGVQAEIFIAELTGGVRTGYKDGYDVTTNSGRRLEVKVSRLNRQTTSRTVRWNWDRLLGLNETKDYDFLVLMGEKDPRYEAQYPPELPYVCFLVPKRDVNAIKTGNCAALNTNLTTARAYKSKVLKRYLVRSREDFYQFSLREMEGAPAGC
jgi:hypothetical protein